MTEEEAKTKWCPHIRTVMAGITKGASVEALVVGNTYDEERQHPKTCCIASACMMWRWWQPPYANNPMGGDGYCGLAGKP